MMSFSLEHSERLFVSSLPNSFGCVFLVLLFFHGRSAPTYDPKKYNSLEMKSIFSFQDPSEWIFLNLYSKRNNFIENSCVSFSQRRTKFANA